MNNEGSNRIIQTAQFGELTVEPQHIFFFKDGIFGFEDYKEFILISEEETVPFKWLLSIEKSTIGFPLISPWYIDLNYNPGDDINFEHEVVMVVITLEDDQGLMSANMKAPIILDVEKQTGKQIILSSDKYSPNYIISNKNK